MIKKLQSFGSIFLAAVLVSGCLASQNPQSVLAINSATPEAPQAEADIVLGDLPITGPTPTARPDVLTLASGQAAQTPEAEPAQMVAMVAPQTQNPVPVPVTAPAAQPVLASIRERECLMRTMYFESHRSSPEGLLAVGTVVMHRLEYGSWGNTVCSVVQARNQFAPGLMTRKMQGNLSDLEALADQILAGKRHPKLAKNVMFFHVSGMKFPYKNMRYVHIAGGNTFYFKAQRKRRA